MSGNVSFKEVKEAELKEEQLIFKERKYEFIDLFNSLDLIKDNDVKGERSTRKFYVTIADIIE